MRLTIYFSTLIEIGSSVTEGSCGFARHSEKSTRPERLQLCIFTDDSNPVSVFLALLLVHADEDLQVRTLERRIISFEIGNNLSQKPISDIYPDLSE